MASYVRHMGLDGKPVSSSGFMEQVVRGVRKEMDWECPLDDVINDAIRTLRIARDRVGLDRDDNNSKPEFDTYEEDISWQRWKAAELANDMARLCPDLIGGGEVPEVYSVVMRAYERAGLLPEPPEIIPRPRAKNRRREISTSKRLTVYKRDGYVCKHCGTAENLTIDHIYPVSKGGTNDLENLQTLCRSCNSRKGARVKEGEEK